MYRIFDEDTSEYRVYGSNIKDTMDNVVSFTLTPSSGGWNKVTYYCSTSPSDSWGHLCLLGNTRKTSLLRVGCTHVNPLEYISRINNKQFTQVSYNLLYTYKCRNVYSLRQEVYTELETLGFQPNSRKGFDIKFDILIEIVEGLGKKYEGSRIDWVS